jgi:hypothetical protein
MYWEEEESADNTLPISESGLEFLGMRSEMGAYKAVGDVRNCVRMIEKD